MTKIIVGLSIALSIALIVLIVYLILQKKEMVQLKAELQEILENESNQKIHSRIGIVDSELINKINEMLELVNNARIHFNRKNHEIEQMMANISHDLRTPLTSALGYIDMIENSQMNENEKTEALHIIELRLKRLKELIDSFFEFSMVISKNEKPEMKQVNLIAILQESMSHYYDDYCERGRMIELICHENRLMVYSNQNMMMRIFDNLIVNALKHGLNDLNILIDASEENDDIKISFINEISDQELDASRLFEEFYTTDISRTKGNTGLGLAIVKQFSQIIGWKVSAYEKDNELTINLVMKK